MTDDQVEAEIYRLLESDEVKLAKVEQRVRNRRRQYMYVLRCMERRGKELVKLGYNRETVEQIFEGGCR